MKFHNVFILLSLVLCGFGMAGCGGTSASKTPIFQGGEEAPDPPPSSGTLTASVDVTAANFTARRHSENPDTQTVNLSWTGGNDAGSIQIAFPQGTTQPAWLTVTQVGSNTTGGNPVAFDFDINTTDLSPQDYTSAVNFVVTDTAGASASSQAVDVTFTVMPFGDQNRADENKIYHYGQEVILNGANVAWSEDNQFWFNQDIGAVDAAGQPRTNVSAFQTHFADIAAAGGNSARIWLHSGASTTPVIETNGMVSGISRDLSDAQVVEQLEAILDAAWDEGILVTFNLLSFNMICDSYQPWAAKEMLETQFQSYIDKALTPMAVGVKDHPALFAWDIFNEPEGMSQAGFFCPSTATVSTQTVQNVVNRAAAAIHDIDPNVKVTVSTHTDLFDDYSNASLTAAAGALPGGTLDFYSVHWYNTGWSVSPYITEAHEFGADRPIVAGEFDPQNTGWSGPTPSKSSKELLHNGYAGAWPWALTTGDVGVITSAISMASAMAGTVDKAAVEACLTNKPASCYTQ